MLRLSRKGNQEIRIKNCEPQGGPDPRKELKMTEITSSKEGGREEVQIYTSPFT